MRIIFYFSFSRINKYVKKEVLNDIPYLLIYLLNVIYYNLKSYSCSKVIFGHHKQLMGLAVHPDDEMFATAGHDKNIALWRGHKLVFATQVGT